MKILIVRFSSIGDIVLTTELIRCVRKAQPNAFIAFATKQRFAALLANNPHLNQIIPLAEQFDDFKKQIKSLAFEVVLDLHHNLRSRRLTFGLGAKVYRFDKANFSKWQMVYLAKHKNTILPHITERYLKTASALGAASDGQGLEFPLSGMEATLLKVPFKSKTYICLAIGGQHETKKLPLIKLTQLVNQLQVPCILLGGREDEPTAIELLALTSSKLLVSMCGNTSVQESAWLIEHSLGMITHDTGMMHIGAALNIPTATVWGNTVPGFGMWAYYPKNSAAALKSAHFEVPHLDCRPCSKIGFKTCPKGHFKCMEQQNIAEIARWANGLKTD